MGPVVSIRLKIGRYVAHSAWWLVDVHARQSLAEQLFSAAGRLLDAGIGAKRWRSSRIRVEGNLRQLTSSGDKWMLEQLLGRGSAIRVAAKNG